MIYSLVNGLNFWLVEKSKMINSLIKNEVSLFLSEIIYIRYYLPLSVHIGNIKCKYYHGLEEKHVGEEEGYVFERKVGKYFG